MSNFKSLFVFFSSTIYNDAVSLYATMKQYRSQEYAMSNSGWILLDAAEQIFKTTRDRVYNSKNGKSSTQQRNIISVIIFLFYVFYQSSSQKNVQNGKRYPKFCVLKYQLIQKSASKLFHT